jgi:hypothetical protein
MEVTYYTPSGQSNSHEADKSIMICIFMSETMAGVSGAKRAGKLSIAVNTSARSSTHI